MRRGVQRMRKQKSRYDILVDAVWKIEHEVFGGQTLGVVTALWRTALERGEALQSKRMRDNYWNGRMAERERIKRLSKLMDVKRGDELAKTCYVLPADAFGEKSFGKWLFGRFNKDKERR